MDIKIYETTFNLLSANKTQYYKSFVPFKLNIDPSVCLPEPPDTFFIRKINKIVYEWGDGQTEIQKFFPSDFSASDNTGSIAETGDPRNYSKTHTYTLSTEFQKQINLKIHVYQFGVSLPVTYNFNLNLKAPRLDGTKTSFFKNMHLVYTKMFDEDNKIMYIFEGKDPTWAYPVVIDWRQKGGDFNPLLGVDYNVYQLNK